MKRHLSFVAAGGPGAVLYCGRGRGSEGSIMHRLLAAALACGVAGYLNAQKLPLMLSTK